ncbi:MAG: hypothetical protein CVU54_14380 [Deltaproteobacteria bacterium HGW-Deltaproteobacteria-12]|jgi:DNA primase|nr:MAG: hypothetical protein CVU54_14380 [Deltaproteobacteria bacterium HGW-Deltaproteobacteria-12]
MIDFEMIKSNVNLTDLIQREFPQGTIFKAGRTLRCNPSPCCGHNDCFSFASNHFHCFSCGGHGDQVDFVSRIKNLNIINAASYCANIIGVFSDSNQRKDSESFSGKLTSKQLPKTPPVISQEKRDEDCHLRDIVTDICNRELFKNKAARAYQVQERGHSLDNLERHRVGYTPGSLIDHVKSRGIDPRALIDIGLVRQVDGSLKNYFPQGVYIYPHEASGRILFFTMKDPKKKFRFQIPKRRELMNGEIIRYPDSDWICYGQDALQQDGCWLVEGENDRLSLLDAGESNVAATIGNFATPEVTAWLSQNAGGRTYFLAFDNDNAGGKYTQHYSHTILTAGGFAKIVTL